MPNVKPMIGLETDNLLITNQLLCQLSHIGIFSFKMGPTGLEPVTLCL